MSAEHLFVTYDNEPPHRGLRMQLLRLVLVALITSLLPPEFEFQELEFNAGVAGDSGRFALARLTVQDKTGECTLGGSDLALRTVSP